MSDTIDYSGSDGGDEFAFDEASDPLAPLAGGAGVPPLGVGDTLLGRFRLLRRFPISGQSEVWAAWAVRERRFVVLKFVHARLLEEARRATNIPDGAIVVHEYNSDIEGKPFLVLEYALGGASDRYARAWTTNPALLVRKFIPVVRTLAKAHARGTIHRDLKPSNLLLWAEPPHVPADEEPTPPAAGSDPTAMQIRVADWGLAIGNEDGELPPGGTPGFAAPEQWRGQATPAADVFGLAATLYFLLANPPDTAREKLRYPAPRAALADLATGRTVDFVPVALHRLNPNVDPRLSRVVMSSLAADPDVRHRSADALADELERWLNGYAVAGDGRARRVALWGRRNRAWVAATALAAVALVGLAAWAVVNKLDAAKSRVDVAEKQRDAEGSRAEAAEAQAARAEVVIRLNEVQIGEQINRLKAKMDQLTAAARAAAHRGDWPTALGLYAELIRQADPPTARLLRAERLFGFFATNDEPKLLAELNALEAEPDLGPVAARVKLVRGANLLCDPERAAQGRALIAQALEQRDAIPAERRDQLFTPADVLYARALQETRPRQVLEQLRAAVKADLLHYPAHAALVVALFASGDREEAVRQADVLGGLFPESPVPALIRALSAVAAGDRPGMKQAVAEFGHKARANVALFSEFCDTLADVLDLMQEHTATLGGLNPFRLAALGLKVAKLRAIGAAAFRPLAFPVPTVNLLFVWYLEIFGAFQEAGQVVGKLDPAGLPGLDATGKRLEALAADYPEAMAHALLATNRFFGGAIALEANNVPDCHARLKDAAARAYLAADQPTLAPRAPVRYSARFVGVLSDVTILKLIPDADPVHLRRVHDHLPRLLADGRGKWSEHLDACVELTIRMVTAPPTPAQQVEWKADAPAGRAAYRDRNRQLYRVSRSLLDAWTDELAARAGGAKKRAEAKAAELRSRLEAWADAEGLNTPVAPPPRPK